MPLIINSTGSQSARVYRRVSNRSPDVREAVAASRRLCGIGHNRVKAVWYWKSSSAGGVGVSKRDAGGSSSANVGAELGMFVGAGRLPSRCSVVERSCEISLGAVGNRYDSARLIWFKALVWSTSKSGPKTRSPVLVRGSVLCRW